MVEVGVVLLVVGAALLVAEAHAPFGVLGAAGVLSLGGGAALAIAGAGGGLAIVLVAVLAALAGGEAARAGGGGGVGRDRDSQDARHSSSPRVLRPRGPERTDGRGQELGER